MVPFAIFVQSASIDQLKAFDRYKKNQNLNKGHRDHRALIQATQDRYQADVRGHLISRIRSLLYRNVKLHPLVKNRRSISEANLNSKDKSDQSYIYN